MFGSNKYGITTMRHPGYNDLGSIFSAVAGPILGSVLGGGDKGGGGGSVQLADPFAGQRGRYQPKLYDLISRMMGRYSGYKGQGSQGTPGSGFSGKNTGGGAYPVGGEPLGSGGANPRMQPSGSIYQGGGTAGSGGGDGNGLVIGNWGNDTGGGNPAGGDTSGDTTDMFGDGTGQGQYQGMIDSLLSYMGTGGLNSPSASKLDQLMANPGEMTSSPLYKFAFDQGMKGVERSAGAKGLLGSGNRLASLTEFGQGLASQQYFGQANLLAGLAGQERSTSLGMLGQLGNLQGQSDSNQMQLANLLAALSGATTGSPAGAGQLAQGNSQYTDYRNGQLAQGVIGGFSNMFGNNTQPGGWGYTGPNWGVLAPN